MNVLDKILENKRDEIKRRKSLVPSFLLQNSPNYSRKKYSLKDSLKVSSCGIIAEFKRKSHSRGFIQEKASADVVIPSYVRAGAAACSVLTDTSFFGGSCDDLMMARECADIPLLRKDFIIDSYQVEEAAAWGADAILLIAAALEYGCCRELVACAHELGLEVLLEVHGSTELDYLFSGIDVVGVNNRDLGSFVTDVNISFELAREIPEDFVKISESGITSMQVVKELRKVGYNGFLIGERFMKEADPAVALGEFLRDEN